MWDYRTGTQELSWELSKSMSLGLFPWLKVSREMDPPIFHLVRREGKTWGPRILRVEWGKGAGGSGCGLAYHLFSRLPKSRVFWGSFS